MAFGNFFNVLEALPEKSTSQRAITRSRPRTEALLISLAPFPPEPIAAILSWSLGEIYPCPPRTLRGTIIIDEAAILFLIKLRLE